MISTNIKSDIWSYFRYILLIFRAKLQAVKLQNYWKKICEDEKRSQWRNDQLLQDFDKFESQMAALSARTEQLRTMKVRKV